MERDLETSVYKELIELGTEEQIAERGERICEAIYLLDSASSKEIDNYLKSRRYLMSRLDLIDTLRMLEDIDLIEFHLGKFRLTERAKRTYG